MTRTSVGTTVLFARPETQRESAATGSSFVGHCSDGDVALTSKYDSHPPSGWNKGTKMVLCGSVVWAESCHGGSRKPDAVATTFGAVGLRHGLFVFANWILPSSRQRMAPGSWLRI